MTHQTCVQTSRIREKKVHAIGSVVIVGGSSPRPPGTTDVLNFCFLFVFLPRYVGRGGEDLPSMDRMGAWLFNRQQIRKTKFVFEHFSKRGCAHHSGRAQMIGNTFGNLFSRQKNKPIQIIGWGAWMGCMDGMHGWDTWMG